MNALPQPPGHPGPARSRPSEDTAHPRPAGAQDCPSSRARPGHLSRPEGWSQSHPRPASTRRALPSRHRLPREMGLSDELGNSPQRRGFMQLKRPARRSPWQLRPLRRGAEWSGARAPWGRHAVPTGHVRAELPEPGSSQAWSGWWPGRACFLPINQLPRFRNRGALEPQPGDPPPTSSTEAACSAPLQPGVVWGAHCSHGCLQTIPRAPARQPPARGGEPRLL